MSFANPSEIRDIPGYPTLKELVSNLASKVESSGSGLTIKRALGQLEDKKLVDGLEKLSEVDWKFRINPFPERSGPDKHPLSPANIFEEEYKALQGIPESEKILAWKNLCGIRYFDIDNEDHVTKFVLLSGEKKAIQALNHKTVDRVLPVLLQQIDQEVKHGLTRKSLFKLGSAVGTKAHKLAFEALQLLTPETILLKKGVLEGQREYFSDLIKTPEGQALFEEYKLAFDSEAQVAYQAERSAWLHRPAPASPGGAAEAKPQVPSGRKDTHESATELPSNEIELMDLAAANIHKELKADGSVALLYQEYLDAKKDIASSNLLAHNVAFNNFVKKVDQHRKSEETTKAWIGCSQNISMFSSQLAIITDSKDLAKFATGLGGMTQAISSVREFSNGMKLLQAGGDMASIGMGIGSLFGGMGAFLGAVSIVSSLFGNKEAPPIDYAALTYSLVNSLREEMCQNFKIMQENFETTWRKLDLMNEATQRRFNELESLMASNFNEVFRRFDVLSSQMHDRFSYIDWQFRELGRRLDNQTVVDELGRVLNESANASLEARNSDDFADKFAILARHLSPSSRNVLSGLFTAESADRFEDQIKSLGHPFFALRTLSSYLNSQIDPRSSLYSRMQMQRIMERLPQPASKVVLSQAFGMELFLPEAKGRNIKTLGKCLGDLAEDQVFIAPIEIAGSWVMLYACKGKQPQIVLFGFSTATLQCRRLLLGILPSYFELREFAYPKEVNYFSAGAHCAMLINSVLGHPEQSPEDLAHKAYDPSVVETYRATVQVPTSEELTVGNPCVDLWLALNVQRLTTLYADQNSDSERVISDELLVKLMNLIIGRSNQTALIVRASHPQLYGHLAEQYLKALSEFEAAYVVWKKDYEAKLLTDYRMEIGQAATEDLALSDINVTYSVNWTSRVSIRDDYSLNSSVSRHTSNWWLEYHYVGEWYTHSKRGTYINWLGVRGEDKCGQNQKYRKEYREGLAKLVRDRAIETIETINSETPRLGNKLIKLDSLGGFEFIGPQTALAVRYILPKDLSLPLLSAPEGFISLLPQPLIHAYQLGLIQVRFRYELIASGAEAVTSQQFMLQGEWRAKSVGGADRDWHLFSERHFEYNPLFYQGNEAIWWYWEGGCIPSRQDNVDWPVDDDSTATDRHHISRPVRENVVGAAMRIDVSIIPERLSDDVRRRNDDDVLAIVKKWQGEVEKKTTASLREAMGKPDSALFNALAKMDQYYRLLEIYLELIACGLQNQSLFKDFFAHLASRLYSSKSMLEHLSETQSIRSFEGLKPKAGEFSAQIEALCAIGIPLPDLSSPMQSASVVLLNELRRRIDGKRLGYFRERIELLEEEARHLEDQVFIKLYRSGDAVYAESLIAGLRSVAEKRAKLDGAMESRHESDKLDYQACKAQFHQLKERLSQLEAFIPTTQQLVADGLVDQEALDKLTSYEKTIRAQYQEVANQLQSFAREFEGEMPQVTIGVFSPIAENQMGSGGAAGPGRVSLP
jgi:hypothetical protein